MSLSDRLAPDSPPVVVAHRALMRALAWRLSARSGAASSALARSLRVAGRDAFAADDRAWLQRIACRRAEIPFEMVASGAEFGIVPPDNTDAGGGAASAAASPGAATAAAELLGHAWEISRWTSIPAVWGGFLTRLVRELRPETCIELGTGLGLSGAYQAAGLELNGAGVLHTVDMNATAGIAARGFSELGLADRVEVVHGRIEEELAPLLDRIGPVQYAFLDAEHSEGATVAHFDALLPGLADGAVVILDDVAQTEGMRRAWKALSAHPRATMAVAMRRVGALAIGSPGR